MWQGWHEIGTLDEWMRHKGGNRAAIAAGVTGTGQRRERHRYP